MAYPSDTTTDTASAGTSVLSSPDHSSRHNVIGSAVIAIENKLGLGAGSPTSGALLVGSGNGDSGWVTSLDNATIGTPSITGGTIASSVVNNVTIGTPSITGGTINSSLIGTSTVQGGTANNQVIGTPSVTGGTISAYQSKTHTLGSATITGTAGSIHTLDLSTASRFLLNMPNSAGSLGLTVSNASANQPFILEILQGSSGSGTIGSWFSTIRWAGSVTPTLTTTASRKDTFGFIATSTSTFDGYTIGLNI